MIEKLQIIYYFVDAGMLQKRSGFERSVVISSTDSLKTINDALKLEREGGRGADRIR